MTITRWIGVLLAAVLIPLFVLLVWQLIGLNPDHYCSIVQQQGQPPGQHCFELVKEMLHIKGWVIWLLVGTVAGVVWLAMSYLTKMFVNVSGPGGVGLGLKPGKDEDDVLPSGGNRE